MIRNSKFKTSTRPHRGISYDELKSLGNGCHLQIAPHSHREGVFPVVFGVCRGPMRRSDRCATACTCHFLCTSLSIESIEDRNISMGVEPHGWCSSHAPYNLLRAMKLMKNAKGTAHVLDGVDPCYQPDCTRNHVGGL